MSDSSFVPREFHAASGSLAYRFLPGVGSAPQPLVVFLHGAGERGTDNEAQLRHVVRRFAEPAVRDQFPCQVLAPQCPPGERWVERDWAAARHEFPEVPSGPQALLLALIARLLESPGVDRSRLYLMGLSMGGYGTWDLACRQPGLFAAAVPVCGGGDESMAQRLIHLPIWAFHGTNDTVVPVTRSRNMVAAVRAAGGEVRYTEYAATGHDSWTPASREPELLPWLFAQTRSTSA